MLALGRLILVGPGTDEECCEFAVRNRLATLRLDDTGNIVAKDQWGTEYVLHPENLL